MSCFKNNCSITVNDVEITDYGPGYEVVHNINPLGGLVCTNGQGDGIKLDDDPANVLSLSADGLMAVLPDAHIVTQIASTDDHVAVPHTAADATPAVTPVVASYTNATAREQLLLIRASLRFNFDIIRDTAALPASGAPDATHTLRTGPIDSTANAAGGGIGHPLTPFNTQPQMRLERRINGGAWNGAVVEKDPISGLIYSSNPAQNEQRSWWETVEYRFALGAGAVLDLRGAMFYEGPAQNLNVTATPASSVIGSERGFAVGLASIEVLPLQEV